jgi:hypothetical protein
VEQYYTPFVSISADCTNGHSNSTTLASNSWQPVARITARCVKREAGARRRERAVALAISASHRSTPSAGGLAGKVFRATSRASGSSHHPSLSAISPFFGTSPEVFAVAKGDNRIQLDIGENPWIWGSFI